MKSKICSFAGHADIFTNKEGLKEKVTDIATRLIENENVDTFYNGGKGAFDLLCVSVVEKLKKKYTGIRSHLILSYIPGEKKESDKEFYSNFDNIIYPGLERIPPRYAILKRNEWMIDNSDFLIAYVGHNWGGAYKTLQYAKKKNHITTYNIYDQENANEK